MLNIREKERVGKVVFCQSLKKQISKTKASQLQFEGKLQYPLTI